LYSCSSHGRCWSARLANRASLLLTDLRNRNDAIRKPRRDLQPAAKRLYVAAQVADIHVGAALKLPARVLPHSSPPRQFFLRHRPALAQFVQCERRFERGRLVVDPRFARRREALGRLVKRPMSSHRINLSPLISLTFHVASYSIYGIYGNKNRS